MTDKLSEPDYLFWSKWDEWTFKEAALLLHGFDPMAFKEVKFNASHTPEMPELKEAHNTFLILKKSSWEKFGLRMSNSAHPYAVQIMAQFKELPMPKKLNECLEARRQREQKNPHYAMIADDYLPGISFDEDKDLATRERQNFLKIIGIMALIIWEHLPANLKHNEPLSASQIKNLILEKAEHREIELDGVKSADRKIIEGLILIDDESYSKKTECYPPHPQVSHRGAS